MRSLIFIASPFRRLRKASGDKAEHITFPNQMDDVEQPVLGGQADACQPCLFLRAGVFVTGQRIEKASRACSKRTPCAEALLEALSLSQTKACPSSVENTSI